MNRVSWCSKTVFNILTGDEIYYSFESKTTTTIKFECFKMNRISQKLFIHKVFLRKWLFFLWWFGHVATIHSDDRKVIKPVWYLSAMYLQYKVDAFRKKTKTWYHSSPRYASSYRARQTIDSLSVFTWFLV